MSTQQKRFVVATKRTEIKSGAGIKDKIGKFFLKAISKYFGNDGKWVDKHIRQINPADYEYKGDGKKRHIKRKT